MEWVTVAAAAAIVDRTKQTVYEWLRVDGSPIRTMKIRRILFVNYADLIEYEATVRNPGRPRKETR